jgi:hypothetical protein
LPIAHGMSLRDGTDRRTWNIFSGAFLLQSVQRQPLYLSCRSLRYCFNEDAFTPGFNLLRNCFVNTFKTEIATSTPRLRTKSRRIKNIRMTQHNNSSRRLYRVIGSGSGQTIWPYFTSRGFSWKTEFRLNPTNSATWCTGSNCVQHNITGLRWTARNYCFLPAIFGNKQSA